MNKYQIFISSTKEDMENERLAITQQILKEQHIPSTMEDFVTSAHEDIINLIIDKINMCDIFLIVIGGRYGSPIDEGKGKGKSYIEFEYEYAKEQGKPIVALVINNKLLNKKKKTAEKNGKSYYVDDHAFLYDKLLQKIRDGGKTVGFYSSIENLKSEVTIGINRIINNPIRYNLCSGGWVRSNEIEFPNPFKLLKRDSFRINDVINEAKADIFISGSSLSSLTMYVDVLRNFPNNKTVKLLSLDYKNINLIKQFCNMIGADYDNLKEQNNAFKKVIQSDKKISANSNIIIRKSSILMPIVYIGVDLGENFDKISESSYIKVQHYLHQTTGIESPNYIVHPNDELFNVYLEQIKILWNNAV